MKKWLKRIMPAPRTLRENRWLSVFGKLLHDPNLWYLNRRSAAGAFAVGFFMMYMPPIGQMGLAAAAAIVVRVNLPLAVALVWKMMFHPQLGVLNSILTSVGLPPSSAVLPAPSCWP